MLPITSFAHLPLAVARNIELGPMDHERKLGEALPFARDERRPCGGARGRPTLAHAMR